MEEHALQERRLQNIRKVDNLKHYNINITDEAYNDMDGIYDYIADTLLEPATAAKQYDRIADAILSLEEMPERIRIMDSEPARSKGLRPLFVDNYTVLFVIKADTVFVARVIYSASDIRKRLSKE